MTWERTNGAGSTVPYSLRHFYVPDFIGTSRSALCENMGCGEKYLKTTFHFLTRLATDLTRMDDAIGLGGILIPEGEDFAVPDVTGDNLSPCPLAIGPQLSLTPFLDLF